MSIVVLGVLVVVVVVVVVCVVLAVVSLRSGKPSRTEEQWRRDQELAALERRYQQEQGRQPGHPDLPPTHREP